MNILLADNSELTRRSVSYLLQDTFPTCKVYLCNSWLEIEESLINNQENKLLDMILLEIFMPSHKTWYDTLEEVVRKYKHTPVCIITNSLDKSHIQKAFNAGAKGYLLKKDTIGRLKNGLENVYSGKLQYPEQIWQQNSHLHSHSSVLTIRQQEVLSLVAEGYPNKAIAKKLNLTEHTIKRHVYNICEKLNAKNRMEAVKMAHTRALLSNT